MATIVASTVSLGNLNDAVAYLWETMTAANAVGDAKNLGSYRHKTVHVIGTFDSATVVMQGTIDGTNWFTLSDLGGNAVSFTAAGGKAIANNVLQVRPSASGGGGSQDVDVYIMATL